ncbi:calcium/sodium antiporter [soil metagenome]
MTLDLILFAIGLAGLYFGSEWLVEGAGRLAVSFGISSFVVGLTVVAFGTSAPELVVSGLASWRGNGALAIGNVVGSNIANIALILGVAAWLQPIRVERSLIVRDVPIMIAFGLLFAVLGWNGTIAMWEAALLLLLFVLYMGHVAMDARKNPEKLAPLDDLGLDRSRRGRDLLMTLGGIVVLAVAAQLLVSSATGIARTFGVSEVIIGLTLVAFGTSVPELAASIAAAKRGEGQLVIGNIVGSNVFNISLILGIAGLIRPLPVDAAVLTFDVPLMIALSLLLLPIVYTSRAVHRMEGVGLLAVYAAFLGWTILM